MIIIFSSSFKKRLPRLMPKIKKAFEKRLELFMIDQRNPLLNTHKLSGKYEHCYSINVTGDYRAIFEWREREDLVTFTEIGRHHELYGK